MNNIMPRLITALTRSHIINKTTGEKNEHDKQKKTFFTAEIQHLNLKAPSNNVKTQREENLTPQIYFSVTRRRIGLYINETRQQTDKRSNKMAKFKNQQIFFKTNIQKRLKDH